MSITYTDVAVSLGRPITTAAEQDQVTQWISDAELIIENRLGDLALLDPATLAYVVREAVIAQVRNPEGYQSETVDDYTYRRYDSAAGRVSIRDEWWHLLDPDTGSGAFSVRPFFEADTAASTYPWTDSPL